MAIGAGTLAGRTVFGGPGNAAVRVKGGADVANAGRWTMGPELGEGKEEKTAGRNTCAEKNAEGGAPCRRKGKVGGKDARGRDYHEYKEREYLGREELRQDGGTRRGKKVPRNASEGEEPKRSKQAEGRFPRKISERKKSGRSPTVSGGQEPSRRLVRKREVTKIGRCGDPSHLRRGDEKVLARGNKPKRRSRWRGGGGRIGIEITGLERGRNGRGRRYRRWERKEEVLRKRVGGERIVPGGPPGTRRRKECQSDAKNIHAVRRETKKTSSKRHGEKGVGGTAWGPISRVVTHQLVRRAGSRRLNADETRRVD